MTRRAPDGVAAAVRRPDAGLAGARDGAGLAIWLLPFSVPAQWTVVVHTGVGVVFLAPVLVYQWQHLRAYWARPGGAVKWMGYLGDARDARRARLGAGAHRCRRSGARASPTPGTASTSSPPSPSSPSPLPHVVVTLLRDRAAALKPGLEALRAASARTLVRAGVGFVLMLAPLGALWAAYPGERMAQRVPAGLLVEVRRRTARSRRASRRPPPGRAFDSRSLSGSESCGTSGCHEQIAAEWQRQRAPLGGDGPGFQRIQEEMAKQNGPESTRYCGGCHDPISLFSGTKNIFTDGPHRPRRLPGGRLLPRLPLDPQDGRQGQRQLRDGAADALPVRAARGPRRPRRARLPDPRLPAAARRRPVASACSRRPSTAPPATSSSSTRRSTTSAGCSSRTSTTTGARAAGTTRATPRKTIECRECHMPLTPRTIRPPATRWTTTARATDGKHRSHRFLGANQVMPALLKLPGGDEQVAAHRAVAARGGRDPGDRRQVDARAPRWRSSSTSPAEAAAGEPVTVRADRHLQQGRPRLPDRAARHHPGLGRDPGHRSARARGVRLGPARRAALHRAGHLHVQGRAGGPVRQPDRPAQPLGDGRACATGARSSPASPTPPSTRSAARATRARASAAAARARTFHFDAPQERRGRAAA